MSRHKPARSNHGAKRASPARARSWAKSWTASWRRAWAKFGANAKRDSVVVVLVLAAAGGMGLVTAKLWLHRGSNTVAVRSTAPLQPAAGPVHEAMQRPVDLGSAKWNSIPVPPAKPPDVTKEQTSPAPEQGPASGEPAWLRFASAAPETDGRPEIAIVIDDVGVDRRRSAGAIELPRAVTLAFLPYAADVADQVRAAREGGHELLVHLPMEAQDNSHDPGPNALTTEIPDGELVARLRWNLDRFGGYVGVNNHMGSRFTRDRHAMEIVMGELKSRGLLFLDSKTVADSLGPELARENGVPFTTRQVFLDNDQNAVEVEARLAEAERVARANGFAIAIGHPHDGTLAALREWLPRVQSEGFVLVPVSAIVRRNLGMQHAGGGHQQG